MTNTIQREFSVGLVRFQGQEYEAVVVYKGLSGKLPAAFSAARRVNEIYRQTIQEMLDQPLSLSPQRGSIIEMSEQGRRFEQSDTVISHSDPAIWTRFIQSLKSSLPTVLPPAKISINEYKVLEELYNRLFDARDDLTTQIVYTPEEQRLLAKLQIPAKTDPQDRDFGDFRFTLFQKYILFRKQLTEESYPIWAESQRAF